MDSTKIHFYIQKWSALIDIFKKMLGNFDFWTWKWSPGETILYWLKKVQVQFYSNYEGIFGCRTSGAQKKGSIYVCRHLRMSKSAHESSYSIQSSEMRFWMIFKLTGSKNIDFSDFKARPQGMVNFGGSNLGSKVPKILFS